MERERETERSLHYQVGLCALWFTFLCSENAEVYYSILKKYKNILGILSICSWHSVLS